MERTPQDEGGAKGDERGRRRQSGEGSRRDEDASRERDEKRRHHHERRDEPMVYDGIDRIPSHVMGRYFSSDAQRRAERFVSESRDVEVTRQHLHSFYREVCHLDDACSMASEGGGGASLRVGVAMLGAKAGYQAGRGAIGEELCKFLQRAAKDVDTPGKLKVFRFLLEAIVGYFHHYKAYRGHPPGGGHRSEGGTSSRRGQGRGPREPHQAGGDQGKASPEEGEGAGSSDTAMVSSPDDVRREVDVAGGGDVVGTLHVEDDHGA